MNPPAFVSRGFRALGLLAVLWLAGCGNIDRTALPPERVALTLASLPKGAPSLPPDLAARVRALDPSQVTTRDVHEVLSKLPAPRVINIHGGIASVIPRMVSFSQFLIGMGYPASSLTNLSDGTYSFSCYESADKIAGVIAWHYEREGLRPMMVGHSQGGMQVVKVLHKLAAKPPAQLAVWNPLTWEAEDRFEIRDPLTGRPRPVVGLVLPYATAVGAGGLTRLLPNQWDMTFRLRSIPNSVEEFTGFCLKFDILGGDLMGYGSGNEFESDGTAVVRNVWLPTEYDHGRIPDTEHLAQNPELVEWIQRYQPSPAPVSTPTVDRSLPGNSENILWAAEVWFHIKKHWVLELQRVLAARAPAPQAALP